MSEHDEHSSFIKTPQQLIVIVLLSFVVPITIIALILMLVLNKPTADDNALTPESIAARIQPVGRIEFGEAGAGAAAGLRSGEAVVKAACAACHQAGVANAHKIGDAAAWKPLLAKGLDAMLAVAIQGKGAMPPRGGLPDLTDEELARAIVHMANLSGGKLAEPAPKAAAPEAKPAAPAPSASAAAPAAAMAAADGKKIYDSLCVACHLTGAANAPKLGDKKAWAPRLAQGIDGLVNAVVKGKGAMPPNAGNPGLKPEDIRAAVEYMVANSK